MSKMQFHLLFFLEIKSGVSHVKQIRKFMDNTEWSVNLNKSKFTEETNDWNSDLDTNA